MKKLFAEIFLLLIASVAFAGLLEYLYKDYKSPVDLKFERFNSLKNDVSVVICGNSHTDALGEPLIIDDGKKTFNISSGGQDLYHILISLEYIIPKAPSLKYVILGLDYEMIGYNFSKEKQDWKDRLYYKWNNRIYNQSTGNLIIANSGFLRSNRDFSFLLSNSHASDQGFIPPSSDTKNEKSCRKRALEHSLYKFSYSLENENMSFLKEICDICKKANITLIIINTPKTSCYVNNYIREVAESSVKKYRLFCLKNNLSYIDLFNDIRFTEDDFIDYDHLNKSGVRKLTEILKDTIADGRFIE